MSDMAWYNVTVGDICLAVIGQITNRPYKPLDGRSTYITSPVEDLLVEQLRAIWGESGHRQKLLESLLSTWNMVGVPDGRPCDWSTTFPRPRTTSSSRDWRSWKPLPWALRRTTSA